jgi:uncharacterized protein (DUF1499 family)
MFRPPLNDVTTTPDDPPQFRALEREHSNVGRNMKYPASFAGLQKRGYPSLVPLHSDLPVSQVFEIVQAAALEMPRWEIAAVEAGRFQLEAIAATRMPLFKEDVVIQVRPEARGCSIHMRCKARMGKGLLGTQANRIRGFLKTLHSKLS